jgi:type VI secretion system protein ImpB
MIVSDYDFGPGPQDVTLLQNIAAVSAMSHAPFLANAGPEFFGEVLKEHKLSLEMNVPDKLSGEANAELGVKLELKSMRDVEPEGIVAQVPELKRLLELREALTALKGPMSSRRGFRKILEQLLSDDAQRERLMKELGLGGG